MENLSHGAGAPSITVFAKENGERKRLNAKLMAEKEKFRKGEAEQDLSGLIQTRKPFTWENLTYDVPVSGGQKRLLSNIFGYVKPGTLTGMSRFVDRSTCSRLRLFAPQLSWVLLGPVSGLLPVQIWLF